MSEPHDIIKTASLTEKSTLLSEKQNKYVFRVSPKANKIQIKHAIEQLLGAKVASIRTTIAHGKIKRQGRYAGQRPDWKKAYVQLAPGFDINFMGGE